MWLRVAALHFRACSQTGTAVFATLSNTPCTLTARLSLAEVSIQKFADVCGQGDGLKIVDSDQLVEFRKSNAGVAPVGWYSVVGPLAVATVE